ncbi:hypothetical protein SCH4B_3594 [Ruegeria sp. TrichCH4B]|nr:hypothetical protein SCH4B_3594 [Ruegeria sp. TrichCH4B]
MPAFEMKLDSREVTRRMHAHRASLRAHRLNLRPPGAGCTA